MIAQEFPMSFSLDVKDELGRIETRKKCCMLSELVALAYTCGTIKLSGQGTGFYFTTENASTARRAFLFIKSLYNENSEMLVRKNFRLRKNNIYVLTLPQTAKVNTILSDMHIVYEDDKGKKRIHQSVYHNIVRKKCCKKSHIRGAFLGAGSVSDPEKGYHLEFVVHSKHYASDLCKLLNEFMLAAKMIERKNSFVVYLKEGEHIVELLNIIGAHTALLNFENMRVYKDVRNNINRIVNCETANLTKTVNASVRQIDNIKLIIEQAGLESLSPMLKEMVKARLQYPDASLKELGQMLDPVISKSGVNHRLRQLDDIASELKKNLHKDDEQNYGS